MKLNLLTLISFLTIANHCQADNDTNRPQTRVIVSEASSLPGSTTLVYKTVKGAEESIYVIDTESGRQDSFKVPRQAMTPALMRQGICVPFSDGNIVFFTLKGTEKLRCQIPDTIIARSVRISDDKLAVLGASFNDGTKVFDLTIKLVDIQADRITTKTIGSVAESGKLFSPDSCTVCWVGEKEAKFFPVCNEK